MGWISPPWTAFRDASPWMAWPNSSIVWRKVEPSCSTVLDTSPAKNPRAPSPEKRASRSGWTSVSASYMPTVR